MSADKRTESKIEVIAEAGVNHNGSLAMALQLIDAAADAGADVVKFQTFKSEKVISRFAAKADYQKATTGEQDTQLEMVRKLELSPSDHYHLRAKCRERGIHFLSTPFDEESLDLLVEELAVDRLKIPSGEITNAPFLLRIARANKPMLLSSGMATLGEVELALGVIAFGMLNPTATPKSNYEFLEAYSSYGGQKLLQGRVTLLHCTTEYPSAAEDVNLRVIETMKNAFGLPVGFSDHTSGIDIPIAAVAAGAVVIEKHFTLDKALPGPDHRASLEPAELNDMIKGIRRVSVAIGNGIKLPVPAEQKNIPIARRSLVAKSDIKRGDSFSEENLGVKRPGSGISPFRFWEYLGRRATRDYQVDELIAE